MDTSNEEENAAGFIWSGNDDNHYAKHRITRAARNKAAAVEQASPFARHLPFVK